MIKRISAPRGCRVVITGAGSGIGEAIALRCANEGANDVICVDINAESAQEIAAACRSRGAEATAYVCDVADFSALQALAQRIETERGAVDILVNNAGIAIGGAFLQQSVTDFDRLVAVDFDGVSYGCRAFAGPMLSRGRGHILNIASGAAFVMNHDFAAYCAAKAGVVALSRCLRAEWLEQGLGVSVICPGFINTPIVRNAKLYGRSAERIERTQMLLERFGHSPDRVARACIKAMRRNPELLTVGVESALMYRVVPVMPSSLESMLTRHFNL